MTLHQRTLTSARRISEPIGSLSATVWNELHDYLALALDALGERPADFSADMLRDAVKHLDTATRITNASLKRLDTHLLP